MIKSIQWLAISIIGAVLFIYFGKAVHLSTTIVIDTPPSDRVVISAPIQLLMYGGDHFLAANIETMRLATTASTIEDGNGSSYLYRTHSLVAQLNPCHEDNYYFSTAFLTWGGSADKANEILHLAGECRHWDWIPPFFYAFNQYYFNRNSDVAVKYLNLAAQRSADNHASLTKTAIMIKTGSINDDQMALAYLTNERDNATDPNLRELLDKRVTRLLGLITLRNAQQRFETETGRLLKTTEELIDTGYLQKIPNDPLKLGYSFINGRFEFRTLRIKGMEK
ncbi:MAG: hypothetical protein OEZ16_09920 [Chromatiales bacterium]|nr:hypothetical protein [Chromatiales bacterium]